MAVLVANDDAELSGKTLLTAEADQTVAGLKSFSRASSPPFAVNFGAAPVPNLVATPTQDETRIISPAQLTGNTDNWNPANLATSVIIRLSTDASRNLTGIVAPATANFVLLINIGAQNCVLKHAATSTATNQFLCQGSADYTLGANEAVWIWYDLTSARWRVLGTA